MKPNKYSFKHGALLPAQKESEFNLMEPNIFVESKISPYNTFRLYFRVPIPCQIGLWCKNFVLIYCVVNFIIARVDDFLTKELNTRIPSILFGWKYSKTRSLKFPLTSFLDYIFWISIWLGRRGGVCIC